MSKLRFTLTPVEKEISTLTPAEKEISFSDGHFSGDHPYTCDTEVDYSAGGYSLFSRWLLTRYFIHLFNHSLIKVMGRSDTKVLT